MTTESVAVKADRAFGTGKELFIVALAVSVTTLAVSNSSFLVFAVCTGLGVAALIRFDFYVYGLVVLLPWYPLLDVRPPFRDLFLFLRFVLLAAVWIIRRRQGKPFGEWIWGNKLKRGALLFAAVATASLLLGGSSNVDAYRSLIRLYSYLAVFFAMSGWLENRRQLITIIKLLLVSTVAVALFGFYQVLEDGYTSFYFHLYPAQEEGMPPWSGRIPSTLFHFNALAAYLNLVLPFALACMTFPRDRALRIGGFLSHTIAGAALYFTGSRGGLLAYGGMLLIAIWYLTPKRTALFSIILSAVLAAALVLSMQEGAGGGGRLQGVDDFTQESRLALWAAAVMMFSSHPILGVGYGNSPPLYNAYLGSNGPEALHAHNMYLQFLAETGIAGFLVFCVLMTAFARMALKLARQPDPLVRLVGIGVGGALATTLIHGMVDYPFNANPQFGALFWLLLALGMLIFQDVNKACAIPPANDEQAERWQY